MAPKYPYSELNKIPASLAKAGDFGLIIIIPAFAEEDVPGVLNSLKKCTHPDVDFQVWVVINEGEKVLPEHQKINQKCFKNCIQWQAENYNFLQLEILYVHQIPTKIAGVGTARKIGMDLACEIFKKGVGLENGIIVNLDADCRVSENYLSAIWNHFVEHPKDELLSIAFEHRIDELESEREREAIRQYENYLHYFIGMQKQLGLPYAYQTIGSAFAVRAGAYLQVGGMNRRKAGEDFYFIHKFTKKGSIAELDTCTVYPSGRSSFRVPFGTGKAVQDMLAKGPTYFAYDPRSFHELRPLVESISFIYHHGTTEKLLESLPDGIRSYLTSQRFSIQIEKIRSNSRSIETFRKAFFQWFDAFRLMKYLHFMRNAFYPDLPLGDIELSWPDSK